MISDKLKEIREKTGMNKKEFADYLGVKYTTYNNYEVGSREPASDFLIMISKKFDISIDYIMGLSDEREKSYHYPLKSSEYEHIKKYRTLDPLSREIVDFVIEKESERKRAQEKKKESERSNPKTEIPDLMYDDYEPKNTILKAAQTPVPYTLEDSKDMSSKK